MLPLAPDGTTESEWLALLADLAIDEAVLLPGRLEAGDVVTRFRVTERLTTHVRHREKYADVAVAPEEAFVFTRDGRPIGRDARTIRDLLSALPALPEDVVRRHLAQGDFRRWIEEIFGDRELGAAIRRLEHADGSNVGDVLCDAIAARYG